MTKKDSKASILWEHKIAESPTDQTPLRYSIWKNDKKDPQFGILLVNGRGEWIEKHSHVPPKLFQNSSVFWLNVDHRGQGKSGGERSHVTSYNDFGKDLGHIAEKVFQGLPYYVLAHSMGGLISMYANMKGYIKPVAMTLCSPLLKLPPNAMPYSLAKMISFSLKNTPASVLPTGAGKNKNKVFTKNTATQSYEGYMRYRNSPFPHLSPTFGWVAATIAACEEVISPKNLELITCPIQILFGSEERIVDPSVYSSWCSSATKVTHSKIELIKIAGARHELLNEIPRIELLVLSYIQNWIDKYPISEQQP